MHGEYLFHHPGKAEIGHTLSRLDVNHPDAARALRVLVSERDIGEGVGGAYLRQSDKREWAEEVQPAGEPRQLDHGFGPAGREVHGDETALARFEQPQSIAIQARRVRHEEPAPYGLSAVDVQQNAAVALVRTPPLDVVAFAQCRD